MTNIAIKYATQPTQYTNGVASTEYFYDQVVMCTAEGFILEEKGWVPFTELDKTFFLIKSW